MSDIALHLVENRFFDLSIVRKDFELEEGLQTAVTVSLFTDKRASLEELPSEETDRMGWWGDMFPDVPGDQIGSKLWLLRREKQTEEVRRRAKEYAEDALQWLITEKIAQGVNVETEFVERGFLAIQVSIQQPKGKVVFKYKINWSAELSRGN